MNKVYVYKGKDDIATIYFSKEFVESHSIPVFEYEGEMPVDIDGESVLKTDGNNLYYEKVDIPVETTE